VDRSFPIEPTEKGVGLFDHGAILGQGRLDLSVQFFTRHLVISYRQNLSIQIFEFPEQLF
jgi:hypothetical protein